MPGLQGWLDQFWSIVNKEVVTPASETVGREAGSTFFKEFLPILIVIIVLLLIIAMKK